MIDGKFGQVTVEKNGDRHTEAAEPVFVLCASDLSAAAAIGTYLDESARRGASEDHLASVRQALSAFHGWRTDRPSLMHVAGRVVQQEQG
jgi:hypothetical protein